MIEPGARALLARNGLQDAEFHPVAGDASARRYVRLVHSGTSAILMIAPPAPDDSTQRFVQIARHLAHLGLSAPRVIDAEAEAGLCLMEDLGDAIFAQRMVSLPDEEPTLYLSAIEFLAALQSHPAPEFLPKPDAVALAEMTAPAADWYVGWGTPQSGLAVKCATALTGPLRATLTEAGQPVLVHRDFHVENLLWLADRSGPARVGVIDFQDAWAGHPAYDLVSLIQDARRDLTPGLDTNLIAALAELTGNDGAALSVACDVLGAQRNLRILGVFARLCLLHAKPRYVDLIPRVWSHLHNNLQNPVLEELRQIVSTHFPEPDTQYLGALKEKCGTSQTP